MPVIWTIESVPIFRKYTAKCNECCAVEYYILQNPDVEYIKKDLVSKGWGVNEDDVFCPKHKPKNSTNNKSIFELNKDIRKRYNTENNSYETFPVSQRVKIICKCQDFHFFNGDLGKVIKNSGGYLGISVEFDTPRKYSDGSVMTSFGFNPKDLIRLEEYLKVWEHLDIKDKIWP